MCPQRAGTALPTSMHYDLDPSGDIPKHWPRRLPWNPQATPQLRSPQMNVSLRPLEDRDLDAIYQQVTDPESVRVAALTAEDQTDRRAFLDRMSRLRADT